MNTSRKGVQAAAAVAKKLPRLVIHFDVNETILLHDPVRVRGL